MIEFYVDGIEIGDNPIGRGAERCPNVCFCYRKARNGKKMLFFHMRIGVPTKKNQKNTNIF